MRTKFLSSNQLTFTDGEASIAVQTHTLPPLHKDGHQFYSWPCQVRFAVLKVLQELYMRLGEEFMILLPETIPFLAELMEGIPNELL